MRKFSTIEQWFLAYGSDVHHFLVYYLGKPNVEDLVQEVFIKALKGLDRYEGRASPKTWLFSIARRAAIDYERRNRTALRLEVRLARNAAMEDRTPEDIYFQQEEMQTAYRIIQSLKRSYRDVLFLRIMEEMTVEETAHLLNWTKTRVNVTLHRALRELRERYKQTEGGADHAAK